ncbi:MAG TPA: tetraacyldisaccharide 4'-kinase [Rudaea sp.]|nr:tetraacyldisaccharide 4'-kinase [Rudaea sp.]
MLDPDELQAIWYAGARPGIGLRALSLLYGALAATRRGLYRLGILPCVRLPVAVIVVGNISIGGTGKTPLTIALVQALRELGYAPGVVSRGYGGSARHAQILDAQPDPAVVGDEPALIARTTGAPMAVGRDRVAAARLLLANEVNVIIADDGLQHYRLRRDVEICVIDGERRFGNGRLLPAGPLRESVDRLCTVDFRVCNGDAAQADEVPMQLVGNRAVNMNDPERHRTLGEFAGQRVHAIAGIGNPSRFFTQLRGAGIDPIEHAFADHHVYRATDVEFGDDLPILMTAKDAVKCAAFARSSFWTVPVQARLPATFFPDVVNLLRAKCAT